jgi:ATP-dependent DNA helicase RecQ
LNAEEILYQYWGYTQFRPVQKEIIEAVIQGKDCLALLPTGGGKSLCYQVPALLLDGICIVVTPLIALMKDQVENLRSKDIAALMINSTMTYKEVDNVLRLAIRGNYKFLYVSPERLETKLFLEYLPAMEVSLIAIDEAHCISQWGYDFRPPYLRIAALRAELPTTPILAVTASATKDVQVDICEKLLFIQPHIFQKSFDRPNLSYSLFEVSAKINKVVDILNSVPGSAIIYCRSRRRTQEVSDLLKFYKINADYYHAGLTSTQRGEKQQLWIENKIRVMVCTNAFGMGIDKPNVRVVIHYDMPDCIENYYQEAGRAGRDEQKAYAVLLYQEQDMEQLEASIEQKYPEEAALKKVYLAVSNYLQLPYGSGEGQYFDFIIHDFCENFKLDIHLVMNSLKILEQEGFLGYTESVVMPSTVQFTCNKQSLYAFELDHPKLEAILKTLLRNYSGIFDYPVFISEKNLAFLLKLDIEETKAKLQQLQRYGIIAYKPVKETPQIYFSKERIHADNFRINSVAYQKRKERYAKRVAEILRYIEEPHCRSNFISHYFGVATSKPCGNCDYCIALQKKALNEASIKEMAQKIMELLQQKEKIDIKEWNNQLAHKNWELLNKAMQYLLAEEKIVLLNDTLMLKK